MDRVVGLTCLAGFAAAVCFVTRRYRGDLAVAEARLESVDRHVISTGCDVVEWAERGQGPALLVSHGIFHGCDGGLLAVRDVVDGQRVIVPSRFGYLGSTLPLEPTSAAQADALVALSDHLALDRVDVIGISAGAGAAIQLALRHRRAEAIARARELGLLPRPLTLVPALAS